MTLGGLSRIYGSVAQLTAATKAAPPTFKFYCTTTGAQTLTLEALTVSSAVTVDWGDSSSDVYTGAGARTHAYAGAGTWTVQITPPTAITAITLSDNKITMNSADIKTAINITTCTFASLKAGTFNSSDVSAWRPTDFRLSSMPAGYAGTFNSADVSAWRPTTFYHHTMPTGYAGTFNSSDVSAWRPSAFRLYIMPAGYAGTFNSSDVSAWRPTYFYFYSMPTGYAGTFNSSEVSAWRPAYFYLSSMPAGYAGTFDSSDVSAWRPIYFYLSSMPAGYAGTFNSSDVSAWRPGDFRLYSMPTAYVITITAAGFAGWITIYSFNMQSNSLLQAAVDQILADFWAGYPTRTATAGAINVSGNASPSGVYQAANPPTTGKEYAYELKNDSTNKNPTKKWTTITYT
jgi:hypothetical protein